MAMRFGSFRVQTHDRRSPQCCVTRDAYFAFLSESRPQLVERYVRLFARGRYVEPAYVREVDDRIRAARRDVAFRRYRPPVRDRSGTQVPLL